MSRWGMGACLAPLLLAACLPATAAETPAVPAGLDDYDAFVDGVRKQFNVPGIAVAIVKDGQVVWAKGYGEREMGKPARVDADTLFAIASNTKAFTAASLSILADRGKLSMNDKVIDHLPWFQMSDPYVTREMTIRDLLSHRSGLGLGAGDMLFWPATDYSTEDVVRRLRYVPLSTSFRSAYAYDNILYAVAQLVIEQVSGQKYADFVRDNIFVPVGMDHSRINSDALGKNDSNVAVGHALFNFTDLTPVPAMSWSNNSAAGGIYSSVNDLSKWMIVQLDGGVLGKTADGTERRLFTDARQREMWAMITPIPVRASSIPELAAATPQFNGYGEGWNLSDYRGHKLVWHTGGWPGQVSRLTLVPDLKLGVVVLTSQEVGAAFNAPTLRALDAFMGAPKTDWTAAYALSAAKSRAGADTDWAKHQAARAKNAPPSLPIAGYAATYRDPWYGDVAITNEGGKLVMRFTRTAQLLGDLEPWQHDTFLVRWRDRSLNADAFASFALTADGKVRELRMEPISSLTDFSFDFQDLRLTPVAAKDGTTSP
jgi:CubicO group peptidase (beta-lactamase class C family)